MFAILNVTIGILLGAAAFYIYYRKADHTGEYSACVAKNDREAVMPHGDDNRGL